MVRSICLSCFMFMPVLWCDALAKSQILAQDSTQVILSHYLMTAGGMEKWRALQSVVLSMTQYPKGESVIKIASIHNGQVYDRWISYSNNGDSSTTCFNGDKYWRQVKGDPPESFDFYAPVYAKYARLSEPTFMLNADSIKLDGTVEFIAGDKKALCYQLALYVDGSRYYKYINASTYYLEGYSRGEPGDPVTSLNDYREIDGLLVPFEEITYRGKSIESRFVKKAIFFNKNIPMQVYDYPKGSTNIISNTLLFNLIQKDK
ncbi:MAG: hypothetical protein KIT62_10455 [Cyclobacteriaceae bacterium]|nr:hypothetical protein [Cyclobacteriaceae bacterium]